MNDAPAGLPIINICIYNTISTQAQLCARFANVIILMEDVCVTRKQGCHISFNYGLGHAY